MRVVDVAVLWCGEIALVRCEVNHTTDVILMDQSECKFECVRMSRKRTKARLKWFLGRKKIDEGESRSRWSPVIVVV